MENTEKRNQHFLPKFYLRFFSHQKNGNQIGLFNLHKKFFFPTATLRDQGSKKFFYGHDGVVENKLSQIEGTMDMIIKNIIETKTLPKDLSVEHFDLLHFVVLTDLRNPISIQYPKTTREELKKSFLKLDPECDIDKFIPPSDHEETIAMVLSSVYFLIPFLADLSIKIFVNKTSHPFITSDYPIIKYNQLLEFRKWPYGKAAYGNIGIQIFVPINSELMIHIFDSSVYKVGPKKRHAIEITNPNDIDQLNILQFINCTETIFFDDKAAESYITGLYYKSQKFKKANQPKVESKLVTVIDEEGNPVVENLLRRGHTDCETNLKINGIQMHASIVLDKSRAQLRPWAISRMKEADKK